jgi:hypothetical protein
MGVKS